MRIVLVRHAEAFDLDLGVHRRDGDRQLTPHGREVHIRMAAVLARAEPGARRILTSPLVRARETAEITAAALGIHPGEIRNCEALGDGFSAREILSELGLIPGEETVVLVGHAPTLGDMASVLLHPEDGICIQFARSAMLCLEFEGKPRPGGASLTWLITPDCIPPGAW